MGRFIGIEGPDGSGKSTLVKNTSELLGTLFPTYVTQEPGGNPLGVQIRRLLKDPETQAVTAPMARRVLFEADRINQQRQLETLLQQYHYVVSDRLGPVSNTAYGLAEGSGSELIRRVEAIDDERRLADLVVLVELPADVAWERRKQDGTDPAEKSRELFDRVHAEYASLIKQARREAGITTISGFNIPAVVVDGEARAAALAIQTAAAILEFFKDAKPAELVRPAGRKGQKS